MQQHTLEMYLHKALCCATAYFGDVSAQSNAVLTGTNSNWSESMRVMERLAFFGKSGVEIKNGNLSFDLDYELQMSAHKTANAMSVQAKYLF